MSRKKKSFKDNFFTNIAPVITGLGASVVIMGALLKLIHGPYAKEMLVVGMTVEAILFGMFAFAPVPHDPDWALVYPQLADDYDPDAIENSKEGAVQKMNDMLEKAKVDQVLMEKLGRGMNNLADNVNKMGDLSSASVATADYAKNVKAASTQLVEMNKSYGTTITAMGEMSKAAGDAKAYQAQVQTVTKNLGALNAVYETELKDATGHLKSMNQFYGSVSKAMENISAASAESQQFRAEMSKLTQNLTSLNNVYGSMLTAMRGGASAPAAK